MITDILGGGKTGAADAASSAKQAVAGRKGSDASSNGFSDTLSGLQRDTSHQANDAQHSDTQHDDAVHGDSAHGHDKDKSSLAADNNNMAADANASKPKPIIDIHPDSLRKEPVADTAKQSLEALKQGEVKNTEERQLSPAEKKLRDALAVAKAVARKSDEQHEKHGASTDKSGDATDASSTDKDGDVDSSILGADDAKIADVLSMLGGGEKAGALSAAMPKTAVGAQIKRAGDPDTRSADEVGSLGVGDTKRFSLAGSAGPDPLAMPVDPDAAAPTSRTFRFTSARNEAQSLDMSVQGDRSERNTVDFKSSSNNAADNNVTVLDSRRFLGLAPNSNGANLTALMSGDHEWAAAMHPSSALSNAAQQSSTGNVVNMLKLQMNPNDLGAVTATLRLNGDELNVHLTVETRAAYKQLSEDSSGIVDALRAQGFAVDQVTINIAPTADSDTSNGQQQGSSSQQAAAEGGRQGNATGRGQEQGANRQAAEQAMRNGNDPVSDNAAAAAPGSTRPGQLYL